MINTKKVFHSLVSEFNGGTCFKACRRAGESMGVWGWDAGEPARGDMTKDLGNFSGDRVVAAEPPIPGGYIMDMLPGYQHFSRMGR